MYSLCLLVISYQHVMGEHKGGVLSSLVPIGDDPMGEDKVKSSFHTSSDICKCNGFPLHWFPTRLRPLSHVKRHLQVQWFPTPLVSHTVASPFTRQATSASALVSHCVELSHTAAFLILTSTSLLQCYLCIKYITLIITCS